MKWTNAAALASQPDPPRRRTAPISAGKGEWVRSLRACHAGRWRELGYEPEAGAPVWAGLPAAVAEPAERGAAPAL
jgi:hypothetical protein